LDVPLAGYGYGSHVLPFAFDLAARTNRLAVADSTGRTRQEKIDDDPDGSMTLSYLTSARKITRFICSNDASSLGLHPALYFYNESGSFQSAALFNLADWLYGLQQKGKINQFLKIRADFEQMILDHPVVIRPPSHKFGSGRRTRSKAILLFDDIFDRLLSGETPDDVWITLNSQLEYIFLGADDQEQKQALATGQPGKFGAKAKSAGFLAQTLPVAPKCALCGGILHKNGMAADHIHEKSNGGSSAAINLRYVHPICNSNRKAMEL
jgi:hypothetical protein